MLAVVILLRPLGRTKQKRHSLEKRALLLASFDDLAQDATKNHQRPGQKVRIRQHCSYNLLQTRRHPRGKVLVFGDLATKIRRHLCCCMQAGARHIISQIC
jgi:hypothetical protein